MKLTDEYTDYFVESLDDASLQAEIDDLGVVTIYHQALVFKQQHNPIPLVCRAWSKYHRLTIGEYDQLQKNHSVDIATLETEAIADAYLNAIEHTA